MKTVLTALLVLSSILPSVAFATDCTVHFRKHGDSTVHFKKKELKRIHNATGYLITSPTKAKYGVDITEMYALSKNTYGEYAGSYLLQYDVRIYEQGHMIAQIYVPRGQSAIEKSFEMLPECTSSL